MEEVFIEIPADLIVDLREYSVPKDAQKFSEERSGISDVSLLMNNMTRQIYVCKTPRGWHDAKTPQKQIQSLSTIVKEAVAQSEIKHPCILNISGFSLVDKQGQFVPTILTRRMGNDLADIIAKDKDHPLDSVDALAWATFIADAMSVVHESKCIHCDIKPCNIFIDKLDNELMWPYLADFGSCCIASETPVSKLDPPGTRGFQAPEMLEKDMYDMVSFDQRIDQFAYAVTLWSLFERVSIEEEQSDELERDFNINVRPEFDKTPGEIREIITTNWDEDVERRIEFSCIRDRLQEILKNMECDNGKVLSFTNELQERKNNLTEGGNSEQLTRFYDELESFQETEIEIPRLIQIALVKLGVKEGSISDEWLQCPVLELIAKCIRVHAEKRLVLKISDPPRTLSACKHRGLGRPRFPAQPKTKERVFTLSDDGMEMTVEVTRDLSWRKELKNYLVGIVFDLEKRTVGFKFNV